MYSSIRTAACIGVVLMAALLASSCKKTGVSTTPVIKTEEQKPGFVDKEVASSVVSNEGRLQIAITNVAYTVEYLNRNGELGNYLVKRTLRQSFDEGVEGLNAKMSISIFSLPKGTMIDSFEKDADKIEFPSADYAIVTAYRCCGAEDYHEMLNLWDNAVLFVYNDKYYYIDTGKDDIFFGYSVAPAYDKEYIQGTLHMVIGRYTAAENGKTGKMSYTPFMDIVFKASNKNIYSSLDDHVPEIEMLKNEEDDTLITSSDRDELRLSPPRSNSLEDLNYKALRLTFRGAQGYAIDIPLINGIPFGQKESKYEVVIDKYPIGAQ